jgi:hypothetical protein
MKVSFQKDQYGRRTRNIYAVSEGDTRSRLGMNG